jgi:4,5:9,10-diseco-3-hydroxy-5,9,17-trioxoandrosta-1(10),2-diene-4-oate hydrolase
MRRPPFPPFDEFSALAKVLTAEAAHQYPLKERVVIREEQIQTAMVRFNYAVAGSGSPVVLVPGSGGWRLTFERMVERLAANHTVYAVDPPGQGETRVTGAGFGFGTDAVATALADFIAVSGLKTVPVVGHSWGGGFALRLAQLYPTRVQRLAVLAPAGVVARDAWEFRALRIPVVGELAARFTTAASVRHMLLKSFSNTQQLPSRQLINQAAHQLRDAPDAAALRRDMLAIERGVTWDAVEQELQTVMCPVLILWGDKDRYLPVAVLDRLRAGLPNAETHLISGAGHSVHDDAAPNDIYPRLQRFLTDLPHQAATATQ